MDLQVNIHVYFRNALNNWIRSYFKAILNESLTLTLEKHPQSEVYLIGKVVHGSTEAASDMHSSTVKPHETNRAAAQLQRIS